MIATYSGLKVGDLLIREGIRLGNDGNQVDLGMKTTHDLDVQGLQRVSSRLDEEDTGVDAVVHDIHAVDLVLSVEIGIKTLLDVVNDGAPRLIVVDEVTEAGRIDNSETEANTSFFNVGADGLNGNGLGNDVEARALALLGRVQGGVEEGVDEGRLAQTRFTNNHDVEVEPLSHTLTVPLIRQVGKTDVASQLPANNVPVIRGRSQLGGDKLRGVGGRHSLHRLEEGLIVASGRGRSHGGRGVSS